MKKEEKGKRERKKTNGTHVMKQEHNTPPILNEARQTARNS